MSKRFRLTPPEISENDVEAGCRQVCLYRGYVFVRLPTGVYRTMDGKRVVRIGEKGMPDYIGIHAEYPGLFIETKRPGEQLRPEQETKKWELEQGYRLGVAVVDSPDALSEFLNSHEQKARRQWLDRASGRDS